MGRGKEKETRKEKGGYGLMAEFAIPKEFKGIIITRNVGGGYTIHFLIDGYEVTPEIRKLMKELSAEFPSAKVPIWKKQSR